MKDMLWGVATSAYQIEGAADAEGKGPSIWDAFCRIPGRILNGDNADTACGHYHRFAEDIALMKELGVDSYRFSLSWPRILPDGRGALNPAGLRFYQNLIDGLLAADIQPMAVLYHWDLPLALQEKLGGWLSPQMPAIFERYADVCFREFGDRVKLWLTLNEPWVISIHGYGIGLDAPGRVSLSEPYVAGHNLILSHARAARLYREKYQHKQAGRIGITLNCDWREPFSDSPQDIAAARRAVQFMLGWFADPIFLGSYPQEMKARLGARLPAFSAAERALIEKSSDYFGLNHYSTMLAQHAAASEPQSVRDDPAVILSLNPSWETTAMGWSVVPVGFGKLLRWIDKRYPGFDIYVTENGCAAPFTDDCSAIEDGFRIRYLDSYISEALKCKAAGVPLRGYYVWSLLDNFEWASGFSQRFGLVHIDYKTLKRSPKESFKWYRGFVSKMKN